MNNYSYSTLSKFACPYAGYLYNIVGLRPRHKRIIDHDSLYGIAFAAGLAKLYQADSIFIPDLLDQAKAEFSRLFINTRTSEKAKTLANGFAALDEYYNTCFMEDMTYMEILEVEQGSRMSNGLIVHPDLVYRDRRTGNIYGLDHKVTGSSYTEQGERKGKGGYLSADWFSKYESSHQIALYTKYIEETYGECAGFEINAIGLIWTDKAKLFGIYDPEASKYSIIETRESETATHKKAYGPKHLAASGLQIRLARHLFNPSKEQINDVIKSAEAKIARIESANIRSNIVDLTVTEWLPDGFRMTLSKEGDVLDCFPQEDSLCWRCEYKPACNAGFIWPRNSEAIQNQFRLICNVLYSESLRPCQLEPEHQGEHSSEDIISKSRFDIEIGDLDIEAIERMQG